jgi:hypothetical protein
MRKHGDGAFEHFGIEIGMEEAWRQICKKGDRVIPAFVPNRARAFRKTLENM